MPARAASSFVARAMRAAPAAAPAPTPAAPVATAPLRAVVADAVKRWYEDALREAQRGDVVRRGEGREAWRALPAAAGAASAPSPTLPSLLSSETAGPTLSDAGRGIRLPQGPRGGGPVGGQGEAAGRAHARGVLHAVM